MTQLLDSGRVEHILHHVNSMIGNLISELQIAAESAPKSSASQGTWYQPKICLQGSHLIINELVIPLATRPKTLVLIEAFLSNSSRKLTRQEILKIVYQNHRSDDDISSRLYFSCYQNMLKLISRSRRLLDQAVNRNMEDNWIEWFVHDKASKQWALYQVHGLTKQVSEKLS